MAVLQNKTPCIETTFAKNRLGYGTITPKRGKGQTLHHRAVWQEHNGPIPKGMLIRHLCHNPSCINIEHLAIGTMKDNIQDCKDAGRIMNRANLGAKNGRAVITESQAQEILDCKINPTPRGYSVKIANKFKKGE